MSFLDYYFAYNGNDDLTVTNEDNLVVIEITMPGVNKEDITLKRYVDRLSIKYKKKAYTYDLDDNDKKYGAISAKLDLGILRIEIPFEKIEPTSITIN